MDLNQIQNRLVFAADNVNRKLDGKQHSIINRARLMAMESNLRDAAAAIGRVRMNIREGEEVDL